MLRKPWVLREPNSALAYPNSLEIQLPEMAATTGCAAVAANSHGGDLYWGSLGFGGKRQIIPNAVPVEEIEQTAASDLSEFGLAPSQKIMVY